jgi:chloride channel, nucleotide-sensitive, 1A
LPQQLLHYSGTPVYLLVRSVSPIPPVGCMQGVFENPPFTGAGAPELGEDEEVVRTVPAVTLVAEADECGAPGPLFITTRRLVWRAGDASRAYSVGFSSISMHAISRDPEEQRGPCIYAQVDGAFPSTSGASAEEGGEDAGEERDPYAACCELRLYPADPSELDAVFEDLCRCAALNPDDEEDEDDEEGEGEGFYYNEEEVLAGARLEGAAALRRFDQMLTVEGEEGDEVEYEEGEDARFEDAEEGAA